jgi:hypothetical protein
VGAEWAYGVSLAEIGSVRVGSGEGSSERGGINAEVHEFNNVPSRPLISFPFEKRVLEPDQELDLQNKGPGKVEFSPASHRGRDSTPVFKAIAPLKSRILLL